MPVFGEVCVEGSADSGHHVSGDIHTCGENTAERTQGRHDKRGLCRRYSEFDRSKRYHVVREKLLLGNRLTVDLGAVFAGQVFNGQSVIDYFEFCMAP